MPIKFIPANCPNCGGELRVPDDLEKVKCMYCGAEVLIRDSSKIDVNMFIKVDISKTLKLAKISENAENYIEGYKYYSQVIESDPENQQAWLGRARCTAWLTKEDGRNFKEAISYLKIAHGIGDDPNNKFDFSIMSILKALDTFNDKIFDEMLEKDFKNISAIHKIFIESFFPTTNRTATYCWSLRPTERVADKIIEIYQYIVASDVDDLKDYGKLLETIYEKYPEKRATKKECFIATAAMGNIDHPYVETLRQYRDVILTKGSFGRALISQYYRFSPFLAQLISRFPLLRRFVRVFLINPFYWFASLELKRY